MSQRGKKMAKKSRRCKLPRICIDSLPLDCPVVIRAVMSRSNLSCQSCVCCTEDTEEFPPTCCESLKCQAYQRRNDVISRQTQTRCAAYENRRSVERFCQVDARSDPNCPICNRSTTKEADVLCEECQKAQSREVEHTCPLCKARREQERAESARQACKSQQTSSKTQEVRCPSCSKPVAIQMPCCDPASRISIMIIPENLLKEKESTSTCTDCEIYPEESKKEPCKRAEEKKDLTCCDLEVKRKPEPIIKITEDQCCPKIPCCAIETCKSNKSRVTIDPSELDKKRKTSKSKMDKKVECSENCKAMKEGTGCCCTFPPAYKQYSCIGKISGTCECEKQGVNKDE